MSTTRPHNLWDDYPIGSTWQVTESGRETTSRTVTALTEDGLIKYTSSAYPGVTFISSLAQWVRWAGTARRLQET